ncbi:hypothetical protein [Devosia sp. A369]
MSDIQGYTFYTYSSASGAGEDRWHDDGVSNEFFDNEISAREAVAALFLEIGRDGEEVPRTMLIERIEIVPLTKQNVLALLNNDLSSFILRYEVIDTVNSLN